MTSNFQKAYMEHKAGKFFQTYGFLAWNASDEDDKAAAVSKSK